jgi:type IV secretory pathway VirB10-like protein
MKKSAYAEKYLQNFARVVKISSHPARENVVNYSMKSSLLILSALLCSLAPVPVTAAPETAAPETTQTAPTPTPIPAPIPAPVPAPATESDAPESEPAEPEAAPPPSEKPPTKKPKKNRSSTKAKKEKKTDSDGSGFNPKSFLMKLVLAADEDDDGALSTHEFRQVPLLKEIKKERIDSLFGEIDENKDARLDADEVSKGLGKMTNLAKDGSRAALDSIDGEDGEEDALARQLKKLKGLPKK